MRRMISVFLYALTLFLVAAPAGAQPKPKDPVMHNEMVAQFRAVNEALNQIMAKLSTLEAEVARLKQLENEIRNAQGAMRATDQKLSDFSTGATRDLIDLKRDMTQLRSDVVSLGGEIRRAGAQAPQPQPTPGAPLPEGYITEVSDSEVTINLGSGSGVREGMRFAVYRASDPKSEIGRIAIKHVLDGNNSKCEITFKRPDVKFEFSDIVKPL